jgi:hypothetical protein
MNNKGSVTVETAIIMPVIFFFICSCISLTVTVYSNNRNKVIMRRGLYNTTVRRPEEVIRNSEYILELVNKAKSLIDVFKKEGVNS